MTACAPQVPTPISYAIVNTESNFNPYAIGVNKGKGLVRQPRSYQEAVQVAYRLRSEGKNFDVGLAQINITNFGWLGLSIEKAFNPCENLKAMQKVYLNCLSRFANSGGQGTPMQRAFSCYNTGNASRGFRNGYVAKVTNHYSTVFNQPNPQITKNQTYTAKNATGTLVSVSSGSVLPNQQNQKINASEPTGGDLTVSDNQPNQLIQSNYASWDIFKELSN
ncbi:lytic transglycosylase domain-containing protein [Moraxella catarrhalis]|uniref:lytic transglycosylase domain-containing protein n=1 Tax=Moraxella catarrhalis TaxID=480 RepID=UPI00128D3778|nr:lytic transglycosylase domain-containing protein [Moraxella catarrhalis]